jgi:hypothetical protein
MKSIRFASLPLLLALAFCTSAFGQNRVTDTSTTTIPYWHEGDNQTIAIVKSRKQYKGSKLKESFELEYTVEMTVLEETDSFYLIEWIYKGLNNEEAKRYNEYSLLSNMVDGLRVVYKTNEVGTFMELVNYDEVASTLKAVADSMMGMSSNSEAEAMIIRMKQLLLTKQGIETISLKEIQLYHNVYGLEVYLDDEIIEESYFPNSFGGRPFPTELRLELVELDTAEMTCKIEVQQTMDKVEGAKVMKELWETLSKEQGFKMFKDEDIPTIVMKDNISFYFELKSGWQTKLKYKRTVVTSGTRQIDKIEMRLR